LFYLFFVGAGLVFPPDVLAFVSGLLLQRLDDALVVNDAVRRQKNFEIVFADLNLVSVDFGHENVDEFRHEHVGMNGDESSDRNFNASYFFGSRFEGPLKDRDDVVGVGSDEKSFRS
jgi:hypothetical protein